MNYAIIEYAFNQTVNTAMDKDLFHWYFSPYSTCQKNLRGLFPLFELFKILLHYFNIL